MLNRTVFTPLKNEPGQGISSELGVHRSFKWTSEQNRWRQPKSSFEGCSSSAWTSSRPLTPLPPRGETHSSKTQLWSPVWCFSDPLGSMSPDLLCAPFAPGPDFHTALVMSHCDCSTVFLLYQASSLSGPPSPAEHSQHQASCLAQPQDHDCVNDDWNPGEKRETMVKQNGWGQSVSNVQLRFSKLRPVWKSSLSETT